MLAINNDSGKWAKMAWNVGLAGLWRNVSYGRINIIRSDAVVRDGASCAAYMGIGDDQSGLVSAVMGEL